MVKNALVRETLSEEMINAGRYLLEQLDSVKSDIKSFFWFFFPEEKIWKLIIASPLVKKEGPRSFYKRIIDINRSLESDDKETISLNNILVVNTENEIVKLLGFFIDTGDTISGIRFTGNTINGVYIEDAFIYRSNVQNKVKKFGTH